MEEAHHIPTILKSITPRGLSPVGPGFGKLGQLTLECAHRVEIHEFLGESVVYGYKVIQRRKI